jgi:arylsulfatase A-like enzyme
MSSISRRDFLKLSGALTASTLARPGVKLFPTRLSANPDARNVLIIVFDALSARHINFYGYPRETMPNLTRLLERAAVYHNHYASANFTSPGTASILTGRHVWQHLALSLTDVVNSVYSTRNIFSYFDDYYKLAYTHNYFAEILLTQFQQAITHHEFFKAQFLRYQQTGTIPWFENLMIDDYDTNLLLNTRLGDPTYDGYLYSLLFPNLLAPKEFQPPEEIKAMFPRGVPEASAQDPFILEDGINWTIEQADSMPQPFLGYLHFLPPHDPYNTRIDFVDTFLEDGYLPPEKPADPYSLDSSVIPRNKELTIRQDYDEFILYADSEFNRLFNHLDQQGLLENTMVVLTSDHGEIVERGSRGHNMPYLFEPVIRVPLVIFEPGQTDRQDIHDPTSCIDLLPTLLHYTGHQVPNDLPGQILPPFAGSSTIPDRKIFSLFVKEKKGFSQLTITTLMMRKGSKKVIRYSGYSGLELFRSRAERLQFDLDSIPDPQFLVFDLDQDPEELHNLADHPTAEVQQLIDELEQIFHEQIEFPQAGNPRS